MSYNSDKHHRRSVRLENYDYSQVGAYFITICSWQRNCIFGEIQDNAMCLNKIGNIIQKEWLRTSQIRLEVLVDEFVIMPNHLHGILIIQKSAPIVKPTVSSNSEDKANSSRLVNKAGSLGTIIRGFKSATTSQINRYRNWPGGPVWQHNYYEHIIRNDNDLNRIREYIINNPARWTQDSDNPLNQVYNPE